MIANSHRTARIVRAGGLVLAVLLALLPPAAPALAQPGDFTETFETAELTGWEHSPGAAVAGGSLQIRPGNFAVRFGAWSDFTLAARLRCTGPGELVLNYRQRDDGHYGVHLGGESVSLERVARGASQVLASAPGASLRFGEWLDVQVTVSGGQHQVSVDGQSLLQATDPSPLPAGGVGFVAVGETVASIDELRLSAAPAAGPAQPGPPAQGPGAQPPQPTPVPAPAAPPAAGNWLDALLAAPASQVDLGTFAINLLLAAVLSFVLSRVYVYWGTSLTNRRKFAANFMLVTVTTTFIILVVRSSVALSLGLVGALSIVRFRAAVKEPEELVYLFLSIGLGIGLGDNQRLITVIALAAAIALIGIARLFRRPDADANLHVTVTSRNPGKVDLDAVRGALQPHCAQLKLMRFDENEAVLEAAYLVEFRSPDDLRRAREALRGLSDRLEISFADNRGIW